MKKIKTYSIHLNYNKPVIDPNCETRKNIQDTGFPIDKQGIRYSFLL